MAENENKHPETTAEVAEESAVETTPVEASQSSPSQSSKPAPKAQAKKPVTKKPNIFVRIGRRLKKFGIDYWSELKKVSWMSGSDVRKSSGIVIVTVIVLGAIIGVVDFAFSTIIEGVSGFIG